MEFKYKLSEMSKTASPEAAEKELGKPKSEFKVGDISISPDGTTKSTIYKIDDETGQISWKIEQLPGYDKMFNELDDLVTTAKRTAAKSTEDPKFKDFYDQIRQIRNEVRTHIRKEHPEIYSRIRMRMGESEVEEISTSGAAGSYLTKYAFRIPKKQKEIVPEGIGATLGPGPKASEEGVKDNYYIKKFKYQLVPKDKNGNYVQKGSGLEVKNF